MNEFSREHEDDGATLTDVAIFIKDKWKAISIGVVAGALLFGSIAYISPKYQASASMQVATVAGEEVESANILAEKLKMPMYYSPDTFAACDVTDPLESGEVFVKRLRRSLAKSAPIISIDYKAKSADDARRCLEGVLNDIRLNQQVLAKPKLEVKRNKLNNLKQKLESADKIVNVLPAKNQGFDFSDSKFSASTLLLAAMLSKENEVSNLRAEIFDLEMALAEPQTKDAALITPIYASATRVGPDVGLIAFLGGVIGGILVVGYMLGRRVWIKIRSI